MTTIEKSVIALTALLGGGEDLTERSIEAFGCVWTVIGRNYLVDWDIERPSERDGYVTRTSIAAEVLPENHPHHARLLPPNLSIGC